MRKYLLLLFVLISTFRVLAHPMPGSVVHLSILEDRISGEAQIPLVELGSAVGDERLKNIRDLFFDSYFVQHLRAVSKGKVWTTEIGNIERANTTDSTVGKFEEVIVRFTLIPPSPDYLRRFTLHYDAVIHQVVTHSALVYVKQDWDNGIQNENDTQQLGVIAMDIPTGKILPLEVNLEGAGWWKGFKSIVISGMNHISEGTDHLLFILVLLFPSMLIYKDNKWRSFGGVKYSLKRLLKIVTAFTAGHSVTLLLGALQIVQLPGQPVEVLIAFSILVSAVHAIKPLFPGRETVIAAGFGLIHGLAFASVLSGLDLGASRMALTILGFNLGIEMMQVFVIAITIPWLLLVSQTSWYTAIRIAGAALAAIASIGWIIERLTNKVNFVTDILQQLTGLGLPLIALFALVSITVYFIHIKFPKMGA